MQQPNPLKSSDSGRSIWRFPHKKTQSLNPQKSEHVISHTSSLAFHEKFLVSFSRMSPHCRSRIKGCGSRKAKCTSHGAGARRNASVSLQNYEGKAVLREHVSAQTMRLGFHAPFARFKSAVPSAQREKKNMPKFSELGLSKQALKAVKKLGYENPSPVQEQAIPFVLEGRDLIAAASTGTGKTAAFLLPIMSMLEKGEKGPRAPRVLVVTPTRELAQQIAFTCIKISRETGHYASTVYGGTPYGPQIRELRRGTDILIATPGRLNDLMKRDVVDLGSIEALVLDEADRMLDMGFLPDVTTIVEAIPEERQTLLFSATIDKSIEKNLSSLLHDPAVVQIAQKGETAKSVEQFIMPIPFHDKPELLKAVLKEKGHERVIVFVRTKNRTEECATMLNEAGFSAETIHSDKRQGHRRRALENFRKGRTDILVATDVLARGIDVKDVDHVINYDLPDMPEDYVHRIGRTGRGGEKGYAISFVSPNQRRLLRDIEDLIGREIPFMDLESYFLDPDLLKKGKKKHGGKKNSDGRQGSGKGYKPRSGNKHGKPFKKKSGEGKHPQSEAAKNATRRIRNKNKKKDAANANEMQNFRGPGRKKNKRQGEPAGIPSSRGKRTGGKPKNKVHKSRYHD